MICDVSSLAIFFLQGALCHHDHLVLSVGENICIWIGIVEADGAVTVQNNEKWSVSDARLLFHSGVYEHLRREC